ncbi:hypothetical protein WICPIJ_006743 [Wickerhamomyces pijperi]|uniref:Uncharacterized protein n=1 Tax=Wickerhamomyces pijperi TaxID=599730 RepID=A0A9P8Q156_WICPI|nr:hypothetical protein WICPIJ_006743 [Wickerhamomyces pijperi]
MRFLGDQHGTNTIDVFLDIFQGWSFDLRLQRFQLFARNTDQALGFQMLVHERIQVGVSDEVEMVLLSMVVEEGRRWIVDLVHQLVVVLRRDKLVTKTIGLFSESVNG